MAPEDDVAVLHLQIRGALLEHGRGRKCRLCPVIVQAVAGSLDDGMAMHKQVIHGIGAVNSDAGRMGKA